MAKKCNLLIDLDGTLTDPKLGIVRCIQHALEKLEYPVPEEDALLGFIGPPLKASFKNLLAGHGLDAGEAVTLYRERFATIGMLENDLYAGVKEMLSQQVVANKRLFIASTKPHVYIHPILKHFEIEEYFERVYGSELDGTRAIKADLLRYIFSELDLNAAETVMIGDRIHDIEAAKAVGITSIWVDYGYGDEAEREAAKPDEVCFSIEELHALLNTI